MKRIVLVGAVLIAACSKTAEPIQTKAPGEAAPLQPLLPPSSPHGAAPAEAPGSGGPKDIAWDAPPSWTVAANPSTMRKATYKIPPAKGDSDDTELSVSQAGGSLDANLDRWSHQFKEAPKPTTESRTVAGMHVTIVEIRGTWNGSGMPGAPAAGPKERYVMLAAIADTDPPHFFKMVGPEKTVQAARAAFDKMVGSFKAKESTPLRAWSRRRGFRGNLRASRTS